MKKEEKIELDEALYKKGKVIKKNEHKNLALKRLQELRAIDQTCFSPEESALIDNEIEDIELFIGRHTWQ